MIEPDKENVMTDKIETDSRTRVTLDLKPEIKELLKEIARREQRSMQGEVSYLVMERAREMGLDLSWHVTEEDRD